METNVTVKDLDSEELEEHRGFVINQPVIFDNATRFYPNEGVSLNDAVDKLTELGYSEK